jgi:CRISPR-associated endonuclease/helicase Cas3
MTPLAASDFEPFFRSVHGHAPFPWQRRLCARVLETGWPRLLTLPTASGKTAAIDIAVFALAAGAAAGRRRIAFVVDRRIVVDEASNRARKLAQALQTTNGEGVVGTVAAALREVAAGEVPLVTATLRGGVLRDDAWARSPAQPVVICSTVDQVGSRLLFRGYGCGSPRSWPIHAGLLGVDTVLIVDEAHCAQPFCDTALAIAGRYGEWAEVAAGKPLTLVRMSATLGEEADFGLDDEDLSDLTLARRLSARKLATLELVEAKRGQQPRVALLERIIERALGLAAERPRVVGVVVNRVSTARAVFDALSLAEHRKLLLTGRVRGWDRDRLVSEWAAIIVANDDRQAPVESVVVVATQCIEVGANLDFDALVTECAALDALRQRFGRLNRLGHRDDARAYVIVEASQVEDGADDAVYGAALRETWRWLSVAGEGDETRAVDFGPLALEEKIAEATDLALLSTPVSRAPVLLPTHLDLLAQTSPEPAATPEPGLFLHGMKTGLDDVTIIWRADLDNAPLDAWADIVAVLPPLAGEGCAVPFLAARTWLGRGQAGAIADADAPTWPEETTNDAVAAFPALRWRGVDDAHLITSRELRPGDTIVVPSRYGGCDRYGWNPASSDTVADIGDAVGARARRRPVLRLHDDVVRTWLRPDTDPEGTATQAVEALRTCALGDREAEPAKALATIAATATLPPWVHELSAGLARDGRRRLVLAAGRATLVGSRPIAAVDDEAESDFTTTDDRSSLTVRVTLESHSAGVRRWAESFAGACRLPPSIIADIGLAAWLHDIGKADPRFQVWLCNGNEVTAALEPEPLAKSDTNPRNRVALRRARERAGYPEGGRHEFQSLALLHAEPRALVGASDPELVLHLVASHHGHARPLAPVVEDAASCEVKLVHGGIPLTAPSDHGLDRLDSGVPDRFWRLVRRHGWWGLAFLEAVMRLADHRRSEEEQRQGAEP